MIQLSFKSFGREKKKKKKNNQATSYPTVLCSLAADRVTVMEGRPDPEQRATAALVAFAWAGVMATAADDHAEIYDTRQPPAPQDSNHWNISLENLRATSPHSAEL